MLTWARKTFGTRRALCRWSKWGDRSSLALEVFEQQLNGNLEASAEYCDATQDMGGPSQPRFYVLAENLSFLICDMGITGIPLRVLAKFQLRPSKSHASGQCS